MRVLFSAVGAYGLVHPMIPLADATRRAGHTVRWATSPQLCERLTAAGHSAMPAGIEAKDRQAEYRRRYPHEATMPANERRLLMFPKLFGEIGAPAMLPALLDATAQFRPDLIVHDAAEFASAIAAERSGVPHVTHSFGALVAREIVEAASREVEPFWEAAGLDPRAFGGSYDHLYVDIYPPGMQPCALTHVPKVQALRPVAADAIDGERLADHLERISRPIVYVTFGTVFNPAEVFAPVVEAARTLDATVVVTVGPAGDPAALGVMPPNVVVERYVPQSLLFDRCAMVASHTGSGTFLSALAHGVPQVCLPQAADQFVNAATCERIGAGLAFSPGEVTALAVVAGINRVLHEPAFKANAAAAAETIATMPSPDAALAAIEQLV